MNPVTIYRRETDWETPDGGSHQTLYDALIQAQRFAAAERGPVQLDVAHCDPDTLEHSPAARPFPVAWCQDGELICETDI